MTAAIRVVMTVTQLTDSQLVRLMLGGDKEAFAELYSRRQRDVYRFALHMSGGPDLAEDVTQEVFMVLMREASSYDESRGSVNAFLLGIAYVFEPHSHTARKIQGFRMEASGAASWKASAPGGDVAFTFKRTPNGEVQLKQGTTEAKVREEKERKGFRKEDLGTQTVAGVNAVGTRTTITIAAGQIGNERAIEIVDERWFSPDLQPWS